MNKNIEKNIVKMYVSGFDDISIQNIKSKLKKYFNMNDLIRTYYIVKNKIWWLEDEIFEYNIESNAYAQIHKNISLLERLKDALEVEIISRCDSKICINSKVIELLNQIMNEYGYKFGNDLWIYEMYKERKNKNGD